MQPGAGSAYTFGAFHLDPQRKRLTRDGEPVALSSRHVDLLCALVARAGHILTKDQLMQAGWGDVAVTDNSLEQAISSLRRALDAGGSSRHIETLARRGYRFAAPVERVERRETDATLDALLAPHRAWIEGRAALETLERTQIDHARRVFEDVLAVAPSQASAHVGLANACVLQFETTRADPAPDAVALARAATHAREACRLDAGYGEAWATLGFVLERTGHHDDAVAALRRAVTIEPDNWRHHVRLSYGTWGEERLRAAKRALALLPGFPMAHWLAATVHVGRQALTEAQRELTAGLAAQSGAGPGPRDGAPPDARPRFTTVGLWWLAGLIHLHQDQDDQALAAFGAELGAEPAGQLYTRECCGNTYYAIGALHWRRKRPDAAAAAFGQALARLPAHPLARLGLAAATGQLPPDAPVTGPGGPAGPVDVAIGRAVWLVLHGRTADAARLVTDALAPTPSSSAGWLLPVEPLLHTAAAPELWSDALTRLRARSA